MVEFEWVMALSKCSIGAIFEQLRLQVERDITIRNSLFPEGTSYGFQLVGEAREFSVVLDRGRIHHSVKFSLGERCISVKENGNLMFDASVTLNDEGRCVVRINNQERELWQLRKMALEKLFFLSE